MRGWKLGLHTSEEQTEALALAKDAYKAGEEAVRNGDMATAAYHMGYLAALGDLAIREGASTLARDTGLLYNRLDDLFRD